MYHGHDMSSHEVVVRSLLEVLQEFGEAEQGDRTVRVTSVSGCLPPFPRRAQVGLLLEIRLCLAHRRSALCLVS